MGLCKCPKRKVTNLFCFEHRVNVCEHCLTENHPRCVVQSYLNWLKDSDYVPNCALCGISLMEGDVVRLICYDVFHTTCMEKHYKKLPPNTAPAGYKCFSCEAPVFPMPNQAGKVIDRLKDVLSNYNWARVGLGLPLIDEQPQIEAAAERTEREEEMNNHATEAPHVGGGDNPNNYGSIVRSAATQNTTLPSSSPFNPSSSAAAAGVYSPGSRWNDTATPNTSMTDTNQQQQQQDLDSKAISRKLFTGQNGGGYGSYTMGEDPDGVDKYKRRSAFSWLSRWIKSRMLRGRGRETRALPRRGLVIMFIFLLFFFTFLMIMIGAGRSEDDDPNFDPHHNPMVHVDQPEFVDMGGKAVDDPLLAIQPAAGGG